MDKKFKETTHLIEEFGLALGPKLVDLELSHDEELIQSESAIETTLHPRARRHEEKERGQEIGNEEFTLH